MILVVFKAQNSEAVENGTKKKDTKPNTCFAGGSRSPGKQSSNFCKNSPTSRKAAAQKKISVGQSSNVGGPKSDTPFSDPFYTDSVKFSLKKMMDAFNQVSLLQNIKQPDEDKTLTIPNIAFGKNTLSIDEQTFVDSISDEKFLNFGKTLVQLPSHQEASKEEIALKRASLMFNRSIGYERTKSIYFKQPQFGQVARMIEKCLKNICTSGDKVFLYFKVREQLEECGNLIFPNVRVFSSFGNEKNFERHLVKLEKQLNSTDSIVSDWKEAVSSLNELPCQYTLDKVKRRLIGYLTAKITMIMLKLTVWSLLKTIQMK